MTERAIVCPGCGEAVPYGRLSCPECGTLLASVAGGVRPTVRTAEAPGPDAAAAADGAGVDEPASTRSPTIRPRAAPVCAPPASPRRPRSRVPYVPPGATAPPPDPPLAPSPRAGRGRRAPAAAGGPRQGQPQAEWRRPPLRHPSPRRRPVAAAAASTEAPATSPPSRPHRLPRRRRTGARAVAASTEMPAPARRRHPCRPAGDPGRRPPGAGRADRWRRIRRGRARRLDLRVVRGRVDRPPARPRPVARTSSPGSTRGSTGPRWLGAGLIVIGMLLPWSRTVIGAAGVGYFDTWGLAGPLPRRRVRVGARGRRAVDRPQARAGAGSAAGSPGSRSAPSRWGSPGRTCSGRSAPASASWPWPSAASS